MTTRNLKPLLLALIIAISLFGCMSKKKVQQVAADELAFVEYYVTFDGKAIKGDPPQGMRIDGPTYNFDSIEGVLNCQVTTITNPNELIGVIGMGRVLRGTEGGGLSSRMDGISLLPHKAGELVIEKITKNDITVNLMGKSFAIAIGENAKRVVERTDTLTYDVVPAIVQKTITHSVTYKGIIKRSNLKLPKE
jgi:hypothetical protein